MKNRASIALGFLALIGLGAVLLASPFAQATGVWGRWSNAFFTAFSAVCVTGLSVVDIAHEYTRGGQIVLMVLVELGGLGLMTCGTFLMIAIGRRLSLSREFSLMNAYGVAQVQGLKGLICWVIGSTVVIEVVGALIYYWRMGAWYPAMFYSIMSFCNAGFSLYPNSLANFQHDPYFVLNSAGLTIVGGIGFLVIYNLCTFKFLRPRTGVRGRISLHTQVVLRFSFYLLAATFALFLLLEWHGALAGLAWTEKLWVGFYQAVTPRTCGFSILPTESLQPLTRLVYEFMMFVGGAPGSVAAGIKVTTFAVLVYTLTALCRGENETVIAKKTIPMDIVRESLVILMTLILVLLLTTGALLWTEAAAIAANRVGVDALFFEAVSAVTTTGLSCGTTTADLSLGGRFVVMCAMFVGRLGALTVVMMIGDREYVRHIRFPTEEIVVG